VANVGDAADVADVADVAEAGEDKSVVFMGGLFSKRKDG